MLLDNPVAVENPSILGEHRFAEENNQTTVNTARKEQSRRASRIGKPSKHYVGIKNEPQWVNPQRLPAAWTALL